MQKWVEGFDGIYGTLSQMDRQTENKIPQLIGKYLIIVDPRDVLSHIDSCPQSLGSLQTVSLT